MRIIHIKMLPDGSGKARIHWLAPSEKGPVKTAEEIKVMSIGQGVRLGGAKGFIACQPQRANVNTEMVNGEYRMLLYSDDVRAATCPECLAAEAAQEKLAIYKDTAEVAV